MRTDRAKFLLPLLFGFLITGTAVSQGTLEEELAKLGIEKLAGLPDAKKQITSFDSLSDGDDLLLAYYHKDDPRFLPAELRLLLIGKTTGRWQERVVHPGDVSGFPNSGLGSIISIHATHSYFFVGGHKSPSSGPTLVLTRRLVPVRVLPGWVVALFDNGTLVFQHNEPHGSGIFEISLHYPKTGRSRRIYPPEPLSPLLESYRRRTAEAFKQAIGEAEKHYFPPSLGESGMVLGVVPQRALALKVTFDEKVGWRLTMWQRFMAFELLTRYLRGERMTQYYRDKFDVLVSNMRQDNLIDEAIAGIDDEELRSQLSKLRARRDIIFGRRDLLEAVEPGWVSDRFWAKLKDALTFPPDSTSVIYIYPRLVLTGRLPCYEFTQTDFEQRFGPSSLDHPLDPSILARLK